MTGWLSVLDLVNCQGVVGWLSVCDLVYCRCVTR